MDRKSDELLSCAIMRFLGWCDSEGGHGTGTHMVSTETLMAWAASAVLLEEAARPQAPAITEYRMPFVSTCTTHVERNAR